MRKLVDKQLKLWVVVFMTINIVGANIMVFILTNKELKESFYKEESGRLMWDSGRIVIPVLTLFSACMALVFIIEIVRRNLKDKETIDR